MPNQTLFFVLFNLFVIIMLVIDLGLFNRKIHVIKFKESLALCGFWISLALLFNVGIYFWYGQERAFEFLTAYLIEYSLSVDNIFVFILIFSFFNIPALYQHKVLFWGIIGALIMRGIFIAVGVTLITKFHWIIYIFGALLIFTGIKLLSDKENEINPEKNILFKIFRRFIPITDSYEGGKFFIKKQHQRMATPLFIALLIIETSDVIFALDSVPAVLAISRDPFIVYTSNIMAVLGLRALFFAISGIIRMFHLLNYGLSAILIFVGAKMLLGNVYKIPIGIALGVVGGIIFISIIASIIFPEKNKEEA